MKKILIAVLVLSAVFAFGQAVFAEDETAGVAGCASVALDPSSSMEFQQNICETAEGVEATSCGVSGHGRCSSPKLNDTMPDAAHCICIGEATEEAPTA